MKATDTLKVAKIHPYKKGPSHNVSVWHKAPIARVHRVVAVVTHHEVVTLRHLADHAFDAVAAILSERERVSARDKGGAIIVLNQQMRVLAQRFIVLK